MANFNFNFNSVVPDEGTTLLFGLWIFIVDGIGSFISHLVKIREFEASAQSTVRELADGLGGIKKFRSTLPVVLVAVTITWRLPRQSKISAPATRPTIDELVEDLGEIQLQSGGQHRAGVRTLPDFCSQGGIKSNPSPSRSRRCCAAFTRSSGTSRIRGVPFSYIKSCSLGRRYLATPAPQTPRWSSLQLMLVWLMFQLVQFF
jgi:hypothetical protein